MTTLSLRRLWTTCKRTAVSHGTGAGKRGLALAQVAFYSGARGVLKVLDHLEEAGEVEELQRVIRHHGRTIRVLQGQTSYKRRH